VIHVQCPGCLTSAYLECACPPGHSPGDAGHHETCPLADIDARVSCPPESACCKQDHDHAAAANSCAQDHEGACAAGTDGCTVCRPLVITMLPGTVMHPAGG
jgi:hypothetical protein